MEELENLLGGGVEEFSTHQEQALGCNDQWDY